MRLTVAICTWNRARLLALALERLAGAEPPTVPWELLVVDNGSTDATPSVLESFTSRLPLRRIVERTLGLSNARNAAVAHAAGDYLVWTDDDVLVDTGWLRAYERAIQAWPDVAVFGGPVRAQFEGTPPAWLTAVWGEVADAFAVRDLGGSACCLDAGKQIPYGANYVTRLCEQRAFAYDPHLGRCGRGGSLGEETAVIRAMLDAGASGRWVPEASVSHVLPAERQTVASLRRYFALEGRTTTHLAYVDRSRGWLLRRWLRAEGAYRLRCLAGNPRLWIEPLIEASRLRGLLGIGGE